MREKLSPYLDGSTEDVKLLELIVNFCLAFCQYEIHSTQWKKNSRVWQKAFIPLLKAITELNLARPKIHHEDYAELMHDTLVKIRNFVCIQFEPERQSIRLSLTTWINYKLRLKYAVIDLFDDSDTVSINALVNEKTKVAYGDFLSNQDAMYPHTLDGLDEILSDELQEIRQRLRKYIENDPDGKLKNCHPPSYPQWNCQEFVIRRYLRQPSQKWQDIEKDLGIPKGSLAPEAQKRFFPLLRKISKELGYE